MLNWFEVGWVEVADLSEHEVEVAVVVQVHEVVPYVPPELRRRVVEQLVGSASLVERERAVSVVHHEVTGDVGAAGALDPQIDVAVAVDVA